jgi:rubrerythrin
MYYNTEDWLQDSPKGNFHRHKIESDNPDGESTWVCDNCGTHDCDPYEDGCPECGQEADMY